MIQRVRSFADDAREPAAEGHGAGANLAVGLNDRLLHSRPLPFGRARKALASAEFRSRGLVTIRSPGHATVEGDAVDRRIDKDARCAALVTRGIVLFSFRMRGASDGLGSSRHPAARM